MPEQPHQKIAFTVRMIPTAKGAPRAFSKNGRTFAYTPAKTDQAMRDFIALADEFAPEKPLAGPLALAVTFVLPIPPSWSKKQRESAFWHTGKPDLSNFVKLVEDALGRSGRWWRDDAQIAWSQQAKVYGPAPEIEIEIEQLPPAVRASAPQPWQAMLDLRIGRAS